MRPRLIASSRGRPFFVYLSPVGGTMPGMTEFSVAPHANPGDEYVVAPRTADFPPDPPDKPIGKGKVSGDVTARVPGDTGDYWILVNGASIGVTVGDPDPQARAAARERVQAQKDADAFAQRNRDDKERVMLADDEIREDATPENRPPNPEDQPNELPIGDNTGSTRQPTGQGVPQTGPIQSKPKSRVAGKKPAAKKKA